MTRVYLAVLTTLLVVALCCVCHRTHEPVTQAATPVVTARSVRVVEPSPAVNGVPLSVAARRSNPHRTCTDTHWERSLHPAERWIDRRESGLDPAAVEPSTGAYGLGQLLPSTYRELGLPMSASPCAQIAAQRAYSAERYGSWRNAKAHWLAVLWW